MFIWNIIFNSSHHNDFLLLLIIYSLFVTNNLYFSFYNIYFF